MYVYHDTAVVPGPASQEAGATAWTEPPRHARQVPDVVIDGWVVQPMLNQLSRDGVSVRLRAQIMDLLVCFARHPGRVLRKEDLLAEVWEGRCVAGSALSRCIAELRAALGDDAERPRVIETIIKRGYRLIAPVAVRPPGRSASITEAFTR